MGLLDSLKKNDTLLTGLLAYGTTGQGYNPAAAGVEAMNSAAAEKAKREAEAAARAKQQAIFDQIQQGLANGKASPAMAAQYAALGGEGAGTIMDAVKHVSTPQSYTPGSMMYNTATGAMSMPAPKMGEGQMWDGGQVTSAPGYLQAYGAQKAVDAKNSIDQYAAEQGIGHQYGVDMLNRTQNYDWDKMGAQNQFDINKTGMQNQYDWNKMERQSGLGQQAKRSEESIKADQAYTSGMRTQSSTNATLQSQLSTLKDLSGKIEEGKVGALRSYVGSFAPSLGIDPTIDDKQQFEAIINSIIPTLRVPGSGVFTDKDAELMAKSLPQLAGTSEGRAKVLADLQDKVDMQAAEAQAMEDYIANRGSLDDNYYRMRNDFYKSWSGK